MSIGLWSNIAHGAGGECRVTLNHVGFRAGEERVTKKIVTSDQ
jgi:hypothetical protein